MRRFPVDSGEAVTFLGGQTQRYFSTKIHWLLRNGSSLQPGSLVLRTVRDAELPDGPFYTWVAGESSLATGMRRHLV